MSEPLVGGVVHENVETSRLLGDYVEEVRHLGSVGHITRHGSEVADSGFPSCR